MANQQSSVGQDPEFDLYQTQKDRELWGRHVGASRALQQGWEKGAQGTIAQRLQLDYLDECRRVWLKSKHTPGRQAHVWNLLSDEKALKHVALEAWVWLLSSLREDRSYNQIATIIGARSEIVLFMLHPCWGRGMHLKGLRLVNGGGMDMSLMIKRLRDAGFRKAASYNQLSRAERAALGAVLIECMISSTKMIEDYIRVRHNKKQRYLRYTSAYWDFLGRWKEAASLFRTVRLPMCMEPRPWTNHNDGGYLTSVTTISPVAWERWPEVTKYVHERVYWQLNIQQETAYQIDHEMVDFTRSVWDLGHELGSVPSKNRLPLPDGNEYKSQGRGPSEVWADMWKYNLDRKKDGARSALVNAFISYDKQLKDADAMFYVVRMCSRGRDHYQGAHINPQGAEHFRSWHKFKEQSPIKGHETQFAWSIGEAMGLEKDVKLRMLHLRDMGDMFRAVGEQPLQMLDIISGVKSPFRFKQLCEDWAGYCKDPGYTSGTIHWRDQSCSGWGHLACLTRDHLLAGYTNCIGNSSADLYSGVGELVLAKLKWRSSHENDPQQLCCQWWIATEIPRSLWKACLMPVVYGRSYRSLVDVITQWLRDDLQDFLTPEGIRVLELAQCLASEVNNVIKEAIPNCRELSRWLSKTATIQMDKGLRPYFFTPLGLGVETWATEGKQDVVELNLAGRKMKLSIRDKGTAIDRRRTCSKLVPDFIHGHDAAFLHTFVCHWDLYKHPISTVHDCFGTTLQHTGTMCAELNDQWTRFYSVDYLARHKKMVEEVCKVKVPDPPMVNTLNQFRLGENPFLFC